VLDASAFNEDPKKFIKQKKDQMESAVSILDFETAAILRDEVRALEARLESTAKKAAKAEKDEMKGIRAKRQSFR
jgi:protein-arginine kinase activator protein McsA